MKGLKKFLKSSIVFLCSIIISISFSATTLAADSKTKSVQIPDPIVVTGQAGQTDKTTEPNKTNSNIKESKAVQSVSVPNGVGLTVTPDLNGIKVTVTNVGLDALDRVTVNVIATGASEQVYNYGSVPVGPKSHYFSAPMISCNMSYKVFASVIDGGSAATLYSTQATLSYTESQLSSMGWNKGTFSTYAQSVDYHFRAHASSVSASNIQQYLLSAANFKVRAVSGLSSTIRSYTQAPNFQYPTQGTKYVDSSTGEFIILNNSDKSIFTYGK